MMDGIKQLDLKWTGGTVNDTSVIESIAYI